MITFVDTETTGVNISTARIVEIALIDTDDSLRTISTYVQRINPLQPIPPEASAIHGIYDQDVQDCPSFEDLAPYLHSRLQTKTLAGYNIQGFDLPLLWEQFFHAGLSWDLSDVTILDSFEIFKRHERRDLSAALQFYCQRSHNGAHGALNDLYATIDVLAAQTLRYGRSSILEPPRPLLDLSGKIILKDGVACYNIGSVKGVPVLDDPGFAEWMLRRDFPENTKQVLRAILKIS